MDTAKIRQRMSHITESLDVGRDIEPHEIRDLLGDLDGMLAIVDEVRRPRNPGDTPNVKHWNGCAIFAGDGCDMDCAGNQDLLDPQLPPERCVDFALFLLGKRRTGSSGRVETITKNAASTASKEPNKDHISNVKITVWIGK